MRDAKRVFTFNGDVDKRLLEFVGKNVENAPTVGEWRGEFVKGLSEQFTGKVGEMSLRLQMKEPCHRCGNRVVNFSTKAKGDGTTDGYLDCVQCFRRVRLENIRLESVSVEDFEPEGAVEVENLDVRFERSE